MLQHPYDLHITNTSQEAVLRQLSPSLKATSQDLFSTVRVWHMVLHFFFFPKP